MEHQNPIAQFTVCISGAENRAWQGRVTVGENSFRFESEMELLNQLLEWYPALLPERQEFTK